MSLPGWRRRIITCNYRKNISNLFQTHDVGIKLEYPNFEKNNYACTSINCIKLKTSGASYISSEINLFWYVYKITIGEHICVFTTAAIEEKVLGEHAIGVFFSSQWQTEGLMK